MSTEDQAAAGIGIAKRAIHALADGNEAGALAALNTASHPEAVFAASYLLAALRETATAWAGGDQVAASRALHAGADETEDTAITQVSIIINEAFNREAGEQNE